MAEEIALASRPLNHLRLPDDDRGHREDHPGRLDDDPSAPDDHQSLRDDDQSRHDDDHSLDDDDHSLRDDDQNLCDDDQRPLIAKKPTKTAISSDYTVCLSPALFPGPSCSWRFTECF